MAIHDKPVVHREYAKMEGKPRWGENTPRNSFWMDEILTLFPDARFIHIVRDFAAELPAGAFVEIRYEDLCAAPEKIIRQLCEFIDELFDPRMLGPHETATARRSCGA